METLALLVGLAIAGLILFQLILVSFNTFANLARQRDVSQGSREVMRERIEAARALREQRESQAFAWSGFRKFVVKDKVIETGSITSFYLVPHDGKPLPAFKPGQFLTFQFNLPSREKPVIRCYSLSDSPSRDYYRVSIARVGPRRDAPNIPLGLISNHFHDQVQEGDIIDVKAPSGGFFMDTTRSDPAVLIAGGVGITPLLSMVNALVDLDSERQVTLVYGVRHGGEHFMKSHLKRLNGLENVRVVTCYSRPNENDEEGRDYDVKGHVSVDLLKEILPSSNFRYFLCGPPAMMESMTKGLSAWGAPKEHVFLEAFGPASVKARKTGDAQKSGKPEAVAAAEPAEPQETFTVTFARSEKTVQWDGSVANLLELAEEHAVAIESGCRSGGCGTCKLAVKSGEVAYDGEPDSEIERGCCLACVARPSGNLVLDA